MNKKGVWRIINEYYMTSDTGWTISKTPSEVPKPYQLFHLESLKGSFKTSKEAIEKYEEIK